MSTLASLPAISALDKSRSIALSALGRNRLQTVLTMSGMTVGVATVLTMIALGTGAQKAIEDQVRSAGMNVIVVSSGNYKMKQQWTSDGETEEEGAQSSDRAALAEQEESDPQNSAGLGASDRLSLADAEAVGHVAGVQYVSAGVVDNARVEAGDEGWFTRFHGESATLQKIRRAWTFPHGRFFSAREVEQHADVAVIGSIVTQHLFGDRNPVGATITAKGHRFKVIGEIASSTWMVPAVQGDDQFDAIYVPVTAAQAAMRKQSLNSLTLSTTSTGEVTRVSKMVEALLRERHQLMGNTADDFAVATEAHRTLTRGGMRTDVARAVVGNVSYLDKLTLEELGKTLERASRTMTVLLTSVATVSLIVGGIGIMNIMLLSVTERSREIGIRRAVGARSQEVMLQFLMEATILSLGGGVLGVLTGLAVSNALSSVLQWSITVSGWAVALSFGISASIGVLFGYYPAKEASRVVPMTALRYE